jgi:hypothetical protein
MARPHLMRPPTMPAGQARCSTLCLPQKVLAAAPRLVSTRSRSTRGFGALQAALHHLPPPPTPICGWPSLPNRPVLRSRASVNAAVKLGPRGCVGQARRDSAEAHSRAPFKSPPPTGSYFWSESFAEQIVVSKVRIPYCSVYPEDSNCRTQGPFRVASAECRGLDEKPGTFTYSRFTCEIRAGY